MYAVSINALKLTRYFTFSAKKQLAGELENLEECKQK
jgi:hypothetical protein